MIKRRHILQAIAITTGVVVLFSAGLVTYWGFESRDVIEVRNIPVPVRPPSVNPEASVILSPFICKYKALPATVHRALTSKSTKVLLPDYYNNFPTGCRQADLPVIIPGQTPDGIYHLEFNVDYKLNPLVSVTEVWYSKDFIVKHDPPLTVSDAVVSPAPITNTPNPAAGSSNSTTNPGSSAKTKSPAKNKSIIYIIKGILGL